MHCCVVPGMKELTCGTPTPQMEAQLADAKRAYSSAMSRLDTISREIHEQREKLRAERQAQQAAAQQQASDAAPYDDRANTPAPTKPAETVESTGGEELRNASIILAADAPVGDGTHSQ